MSSNNVYVVFTKTDEPKWWNRIIHNEINHCYLLIPNGSRWVVIEKVYQTVEAYTIEDYRDILDTSIIIKANPKYKTRGLFMLNTCVGSVKQYLGIKNPFIFTPYQLMKALSNES